jgi:DNA topoisomerase-1
VTVAVRQRSRRPKRSRPILDPVAAAQAADLRYVNDQQPGIRRRRSGRGFAYYMPDGSLIQDAALLKRIRSIAIPPAWTDVWIAPTANGHIQATGRDARRRKQYRYHARWRQVRDETKYGRMVLFGRSLPALRARVAQDLALPGLPKARLLAMIVRLLEKTLMRVGNEEYVRANGSFGLTTLRNRHVQVDGSAIRFRFKGKGGISHDVELTDRRLARLVRQVRDLPGQDLFQYLDEQGDAQPVGSEDVNRYLREVMGADYTAKDFRTWAGTLLAAQCLTGLAEPPGGGKGKELAKEAIAAAARRLGNTVTICRKSYIHPAVLQTFTEPELLQLWQSGSAAADGEGLEPQEAVLLEFLSRVPAAG